ncbi:MAG: FtsQ-type POTRA domain-containing protein [Clostridia bacterium]|nr:FtsQ-type POTRA domain-containing protein [Clostridia bacterium]
MKRKKRLRRTLLLLLLIAVTICICLFTPLFTVKNVEVTGNQAISAEQITEKAAIAPETNLFKVSKRKIKKSVMTIPEIEEVKIKRLLPGKLRLTVTETAPVMYFPYLTGFVVTNEKGRALALIDDASSLDLINMTGLEIKNVEICEKISVQDMVKFDIILNIISALQEKGLLSELRSCHFDNLSDFHVYLKDGTKVIFGTTEELDYKLSMLKSILPMVNRIEGAYIDVTTPAKAFYGMLPPEPEEAPVENAAEAENTETQTEDAQPAEATNAPIADDNN